MTRYLWTGPRTCESLIADKKEPLDLVLVPGGTTPELDPEHPLVKQWLAAGLLTKEPEAAKPEPKPGAKASPISKE